LHVLLSHDYDSDVDGRSMYTVSKNKNYTLLYCLIYSRVTSFCCEIWHTGTVFCTSRCRNKIGNE